MCGVQALRAVIQNVTTVGLAKLGAPATVRVSTRYAPELNPYRPVTACHLEHVHVVLTIQV